MSTGCTFLLYHGCKPVFPLLLREISSFVKFFPCSCNPFSVSCWEMAYYVKLYFLSTMIGPPLTLSTSINPTNFIQLHDLYFLILTFGNFFLISNSFCCNSVPQQLSILIFVDHFNTTPQCVLLLFHLCLSLFSLL